MFGFEFVVEFLGAYLFELGPAKVRVGVTFAFELFLFEFESL